MKSGRKFKGANLLKQAGKPAEMSLRMHPFYRGKIETGIKCRVKDFNDFAVWYSPGVASACKAIVADQDQVFEMTNRWNTVAVVSDGSRVLGLGDIGPEAGLPVMEGKALLYKYLGGVDAFPVVLREKDPDRIIEIVLALQPSFGGVNLEDISQPKCFKILDVLREKAEIPVWHDDQQGTATVILAGLLNALKLTGKKIGNVKIAFIGSGASNTAATRLIFGRGADPARAIVVDSKGILHDKRTDIEAVKEQFARKWQLCQITNREHRRGGIAEAMKDMDVVIACSNPGPGTIKPEWVRLMNEGAIVFACANPVPEIWPWEAKEAGAAIVATGRSDFPNQVNNSVGFPGIFRGALDVRARTISDEMCFAAADALAAMIGEAKAEPCEVPPRQGGGTKKGKKLDENHIIPTMDDWEVFPREAAAVGMQAQKQGLARKKMTYNELLDNARKIIKRSRGITKYLMEKGFIRKYR
jgi:malate dehydrogenase (oxaloacetate-decarboxylating)